MAAQQVAEKQKIITGDELLAMGDIGRCELVEGRIVPMSPTGNEHGICESIFNYHLRAFVEKHRLGKVQGGEVGIYTRRNPDTVRGADVLFISHERYAQQEGSGFLDVAPELVVEILSPNDRWSDVMEKLREYFDTGVQLVWVADPQSRSVFAYRSLTDVREFTEKDKLPGDDVLPGFSVNVSQLFEL